MYSEIERSKCVKFPQSDLPFHHSPQHSHKNLFFIDVLLFVQDNYKIK
jgi:hypothetical protein